jgi:RNA polymerase sigma-70 factor (ECF subfamily)
MAIGRHPSYTVSEAAEARHAAPQRGPGAAGLNPAGPSRYLPAWHPARSRPEDARLEPATPRPPAGHASSEGDLALLERVSRGDRDAFRDLYQRYHRRLIRFLMRFIHRHEDAEEIINDTLWIVWQRAAEFRNASQVSSWIMGIAYRRALNTLRRAGTHARVMALEVVDEQTTASDALETAEDRQRLERAIAELPLEQRLVLEFCYYLEYSCEEIAAIMDCPANTVKTRLFHARRKLRLLLNESSHRPESPR